MHNMKTHVCIKFQWNHVLRIKKMLQMLVHFYYKWHAHCIHVHEGLVNYNQI
jgi:hypothetical protein